MQLLTIPTVEHQLCPCSACCQCFHLLFPQTVYCRIAIWPQRCTVHLGCRVADDHWQHTQAVIVRQECVCAVHITMSTPERGARATLLAMHWSALSCAMLSGTRNWFRSREQIVLCSAYICFRKKSDDIHHGFEGAIVDDRLDSIRSQSTAQGMARIGWTAPQDIHVFNVLLQLSSTPQHTDK